MPLIQTIEWFVRLLSARVVTEDTLWDSKKVLDGTATADEYARFTTAALIVAHSGAFYLMSVFYTVLHHVVPIKTLSRWRYQGDKFAPLDLVRHAWIYTICFHIIISIVTGVWAVPALTRVGFISGFGSNLVDSTPPVHVFFAQIVFSALAGSTTFYFGHLCLHENPWLYKNVHYLHHRWYATAAIAAEYAHPAELLAGNILPVLIGPFLLKAHITVWVMFLLIATLQFSMGHSGIWEPLRLRDKGFHDYHHESNVGNYGTLNEWDKLLATDRGWAAQRAKLAKKWSNF